MIFEETPISETVLPSGLRLFFAPSKLQIGFAGIYICAGSRDETPTEYGVAHLVEHMYFKGTQKRSGLQVTSRIEDIGGDINAYTTKEETVIHANFMPLYVERVLELLADILCHASFPEKELEREREVVIEEIESYKDDPTEQLFDDYEDLIYQGSELGHNILGTVAAVKKYKRQHLLSYLQRSYGVDRMGVFVTGPFAFKVVERLAAKYFVDIPYLPESQQQRTLFLPHALPQYTKLTRRTAQAHCIVGALAPSSADPKRYVLRLLSEILGGSATSARLNKRMREKLGLVYSVESQLGGFTDTGYLSVYFATSHEQLEQCQDIVYDEIRQLREKPVSVAQLKVTKERYIGQFWLANENIEATILSYVRAALDHIPYHTASQLIEIWQGVSQEDILSCANEYLGESQLATLVYTRS